VIFGRGAIPERFGYTDICFVVDQTGIGGIATPSSGGRKPFRAAPIHRRMTVDLRSMAPDEPRRARSAALGGALAYVAVVLVVWLLAYDGVGLLAGLFTVQVGPWLVYAFGGAALVGGALAVSFFEYDLVTPIVAVACLFAVAVYQLWQALQSPAVLLVGDPFQFYLLAWPAVLVVAALVGVGERYVRATVGGESEGRNTP
jgi:hypothetical protein